MDSRTCGAMDVWTQGCVDRETYGLREVWDSGTCELGDDVEFGGVDSGMCGLRDVGLGTMWTLGRLGSGTCGIGEL